VIWKKLVAIVCLMCVWVLSTSASSLARRLLPDYSHMLRRLRLALIRGLRQRKPGALERDCLSELVRISQCLRPQDPSKFR
jgi:hypothetical protein